MKTSCRACDGRPDAHGRWPASGARGRLIVRQILQAPLRGSWREVRFRAIGKSQSSLFDFSLAYAQGREARRDRRRSSTLWMRFSFEPIVPGEHPRMPAISSYDKPWYIGGRSPYAVRAADSLRRCAPVRSSPSAALHRARSHPEPARSKAAHPPTESSGGFCACGRSSNSLPAGIARFEIRIAAGNRRRAEKSFRNVSCAMS